MHYESLHNYLPEIAEKETRTLTLSSGYAGRLPHGHYGLVEFYCADPECDCRRVMLHVVSEQMNKGKAVAVAVVNFGWESRRFYEKWLRSADKDWIHELKGPSLNSASYQSPYANEMLALIRNVVLKDKAYIDRLKKHYKMFKDKIKLLAENDAEDEDEDGA